MAAPALSSTTSRRADFLPASTSRTSEALSAASPPEISSSEARCIPNSSGVTSAASVALPFAAQAQGVPGGVERGSREGERAAGPVGAIVGGGPPAVVAAVYLGSPASAAALLALLALVPASELAIGVLNVNEVPFAAAFVLAANDDECCSQPVVQLLERFRAAIYLTSGERSPPRGSRPAPSGCRCTAGAATCARGSP